MEQIIFLYFKIKDVTFPNSSMYLVTNAPAVSDYDLTVNNPIPQPFACRSNACRPVIAPAPKRLIENSYASAGLILYIILGKYCDHLPLYRQEQIFKQRYGVEISRKTMGGWMHLMANWLSLIYEALRNKIRASGYIQTDAEAKRR